MSKRASAQPACPTTCDPDCGAECHEAHQPGWLRTHQPATHGAADVGEPEGAAAYCDERVPVDDDGAQTRRCARALTGGHCGVHS